MNPASVIRGLASPQVDEDGGELDDLLRMLTALLLMRESLGGGVGPTSRLEVDHDQKPQIVFAAFRQQRRR